MLNARSRRLAAGILMVAGLGLIAAPLAASAHTGKLFTWAYEEIDDETDYAGFASISQTDATQTFLGAQGETEFAARGADICPNEDTWGVGAAPETPVLVTWNHDTGATSIPFPMLNTNPGFFPGAVIQFVNQVWSADSLSDCRKLAYVEYYVEFEQGSDTFLTVSYVDPATGGATPILLLPEAQGDTDLFWHGIATDPTTGVTYLFFQFDGLPYFAELDLADSSITGGTLMEGLVEFFESDGAVAEADFQPDGKLWMFYARSRMLAQYSLISFCRAPTSRRSTDGRRCGRHRARRRPLQPVPGLLTYDPAALPATGGDRRSDSSRPVVRWCSPVRDSLRCAGPHGLRRHVQRDHPAQIDSQAVRRAHQRQEHGVAGVAAHGPAGRDVVDHRLREHA